MTRILFLLCLAFALHAEEKPATPQGESSKKLDFEGETVEGLNRQPLDSLSQISESDGTKKRPHLYQQRKEFHDENTQLIRELSETY
jgi:hypothetical protein